MSNTTLHPTTQMNSTPTEPLRIKFTKHAVAAVTLPPGGGKTPACAHGVDDATTDPNRIAGWWRGNPDCNIGMATGDKSRVFVVDLDGGEAEAELAKLEKFCGTLPATVESITARGPHLFFSWPN